MKGLQYFQLAYSAFANTVVLEVDRGLPQHARTARLLRYHGHKQLRQVKRDIRIMTDKEANDLAAIVEGTLIYMSAAEYPDDRFAMLAHGPSELKEICKLVGLLPQ